VCSFANTGKVKGIYRAFLFYLCDFVLEMCCCKIRVVYGYSVTLNVGKYNPGPL
jgi:hypothetical protein